MSFWLYVVTSIVSLHVCSAVIEPFHLSQVKLFDSTIHAKAAALNKKYLFMLDPDRLLWVFRRNAGLPTTGEPYPSSWEDPNCEIRGHFVGHYLSALSFAYANLGNSTIKGRIDYMVEELRKVQNALGTGYLSAFPTSHFDRLEALKPVWAPYYVIHKIMVGLLDCHLLGENSQALGMVVKMADYFLGRTERVIATNGTEYWNSVLSNEFGGMNEIMYNLYSLTKNPGHLRLAQLFDKPSFWNPLTKNRDQLATLHANTHLAQVVGFAARYDATQDPAAMQTVSNFFSIVTGHRSYATGGNNVNERWFSADQVGDAVIDPRDSLGTEETCTQYNMLKLARSLFRWTGDPALADYYERAMLNGIIGVTRLSADDVNSQIRTKKKDTHEHHHLHLHRHNANEVKTAETGDQELHVMMTAQRMHSHELGDEMDMNALGQAATSGNLQQYMNGAKSSAEPSPPPPISSLSGSTSAQLLSLGHATVPVVERFHHTWWSDFPGFGPPPAGVKNGPGDPGVFLYLLPMGTGQSKGDNYHGWGTPEHSFWCCYGTAVEQFAKMTDSIFFKDMSPPDAVPMLYLMQLTSSRLTWTELNVVLDMKSTYYGPGRSANSVLLIRKLAGNATSVDFRLMFRVPSWTKASAVKLLVNGEPWTQCPGAPKEGTYCSIRRSWKVGDKVQASLPMRMYLSQVQDVRPAMQSLHAIMMGPFVMAGLTHDNRLLMLDESKLEEATSEPDDSDLASLQAGWNPKVFVRHDHYHLYTSTVRDGGDAIDATWRIIQGCHGSHEHLKTADDFKADMKGNSAVLTGESIQKLEDSAAEAAADASDHDKLHAKYEAVKTKMRLGMHDDVSVSLESMNLPGYFLGVDKGGNAVLEKDDGSSDFCDQHTFFLRPGLDGAPDTMSMEAAFQPGKFMTAYQRDRGGCQDLDGQQCAEMARRGMCFSDPGNTMVNCRQSCRTCNFINTTLSLQERQADNAAWNAASSFRTTEPVTPKYPPGAKVVTGTNRKYVVVPLGNIVDERYTVYFDVAKGGAAVAMGQSGTSGGDSY